jgi:hypothetical protein
MDGQELRNGQHRLKTTLEHKHDTMVTWETFDAKRNNDINL